MAVAEGLRFAIGLSADLVGASRELSDRVDALLNRVGATRLVTRFDPDALLAKMKSDKKARADVIRFVLLRAPGDWHVIGVGDDVLRAALQRWVSRDTGGES
jgi:3-dehydroquinate synthetase